MFKILDLYIGRTIISTSALTLSTLVGLSAIIKYVEQLRKVGDGTYDLWKALAYVLLSIPRDIEMFFPMAVLLGALIGLGMLASSSELVVMQAAGFSKLDIGLSVLKTAVPLMLMVMLLGQWGAPEAQKAARELRAFWTSGGNMLSVQRGVWAKDNNDFIYIGRVHEQKELFGINIWEFDEKNKLTETTFAESAEYDAEKGWQLKDVTITHMGNVQLTDEKVAVMPWKTVLTPDKLAVVTVKPEELALSGVYDYVSYLKESKQDASRYELAFWRKALQPVSIAVMMLLALSFVFGPLRSVTMGARVLSGVIFGFAFYISNEVFGPMSIVYRLHPIIGALGPSLVFLAITIYLLRRKL
ncbi:LPS export ABC transporter permease LptG [Photobacterium aphoticum]|uniref:Lipopolysaccharide ABC transporter permease n=1 Tax=Photobacterium aphoticum TaxID=754436 RepID=A0A090QW25_9GAMM|nr:LPS export ABC transporter permease LptG [Photobacterium aphoticum]KLU98531.1 lipopolysaccharide ABC transporter permease [Photobacterium aphoticum]PSU54510.1 LPS export ABC transporter permease LptG [Photobacterium aphoticum]GAL07086.1 predicted permease [Photobacterium aphoticum]GHA66330.1 LPS export ABC transporter permease LptG [Photobacterium aphoticum]